MGSGHASPRRPERDPPLEAGHPPLCTNCPGRYPALVCLPPLLEPTARLLRMTRACWLRFATATGTRLVSIDCSDFISPCRPPTSPSTSGTTLATQAASAMSSWVCSYVFSLLSSWPPQIADGVITAEFDFRVVGDGRSAVARYANNSNYRNDSLIRKEST